MNDQDEGLGEASRDGSHNGTIPFAGKAQIMAAKQRPRRIEKTYIEAWGGDCYFMQWTGKEKDNWEKSLVRGEGRKQKQDLDNVRAKAIAATMVDPNTMELIFTSAEVEALGGLDAGSIDQAFSLTAALNKITRDDVEDLAGNSGRGR